MKRMNLWKRVFAGLLCIAMLGKDFADTRIVLAEETVSESAAAEEMAGGKETNEVNINNESNPDGSAESEKSDTNIDVETDKETIIE